MLSDPAADCSPHFRSFSFTHSPRPRHYGEHGALDDDDEPTIQRPPSSLKRKAGSAKLGVKHDQLVWTRPPAFPKHPRTYQQQSLVHPDFPLNKNIHSLAWDLQPRFIQSSNSQQDRQPGRYSTTSLGSPRRKIRHQQSFQHAHGAKAPLHEQGHEAGGHGPRTFIKPGAMQQGHERIMSGLSDASTPSLSCFPRPPFERTPPTSSHDRSGPVTPTAFHVRGASFEILNPRHSLNAKKIETPAEDKDEDQGDYFTRTRLRNVAMPQIRNELPETPAPAYRMKQSGSRPTPPRSLFDDLPSAYHSIRSGRRLLAAHRQDDNNLMPAASAPKNSPFDDDPGPDPPTHTRQQMSPGPASMKQRLSQLLRIGKREMEDIPRSQTTPEVSPVKVHVPRRRSRTLDELDSVMAVPWAFARAGQDGMQGPASTAQSQHYYDDSSIFESKGGQRDSGPPFPTIFSSQPQHSSKSTDGSRDDSTADLIASYGDHRSGSSQDSSARPSPMRPRSMPLLYDQQRAMQDGTTSTIGHILDQYHRQDDDTEQFMHGSALHTSHRPSSVPDIARFESDKPADSSSTPGSLPLWSKKHPLRADAKSTDIRAATTRALCAPLVAGPAGSLPGRPQMALPPQAAGQIMSEISVTPSRASYGDTRNLLLLSSTPIEMARGAVRHDRDASADSSAPQHIYSDELALPRTPDNALLVAGCQKRQRSQSMQELVEDDIRYFSRLSGLSQATGSIFVVEDGEDGIDIDNNRVDAFDFRFDDQKPAAPGTKLQAFSRARTVPFAAFAHSSVEAGIMRLSPGERDAIGTSKIAYKTDSDSESASDGEDDDELEWQTVSESRRTLPPSHCRFTDGDSFANVSSYDSFNAFPPLHSSDDRFKFSFDLLSAKHSPQPILPMAEGTPGDASSARRAGPASAIYTPYRHPSPMSDTHDNPFSSSPPQIMQKQPDRPWLGSRSISDPPSQASQHPGSMYHNHNLSVIPEQTEHGVTVDLKHGRAKPSIMVHSSSSSVVLSIDSHDGFGSGPGPSFSLDAEDGSPSKCLDEKRKSCRLTSGADTSLLHRLREDDPRVASSPLSHTNSFAKVSHLGPDANITGTPNGTGMRIVGSSVVGSSSPVVADSSPPPISEAGMMTPATPQSLFESRLSQPSATDPVSPLARYDKERFLTPSSAIKGKQPQIRRPQRAVHSQRRLMQMSLTSNEMLQVVDDAIARASQESAMSVAGRRPLLPLAKSLSVPRLQSRYRSPSSNASGLYERKRKISWICFAMCACFPYLLILYGHSALDGMISFITGNEIQHFGQKQKKVAKIAGWSTAAITVVALIVAFVIIRTVPNDFPR